MTSKTTCPSAPKGRICSIKVEEIEDPRMRDLRIYLAEHAATMPRTALRYAIERMDKTEREYWMKKKGQ